MSESGSRPGLEDVCILTDLALLTAAGLTRRLYALIKGKASVLLGPKGLELTMKIRHKNFLR